MRKVELSNDLETQVDELVRLGLGSIRGGGRRAVPPGTVPQPERPNIPDPSRDILKM